MMRQWFEVTLLSDVAVGSGNTFQGTIESMDYLPGNLFLGTAAARIYAESAYSERETFTLFHEGRVRFSDAWPLAPSNEPAWPMPRCWRRIKYQPYQTVDQKDNSYLISGRIVNLLDQAKPRTVKSLNGGYVSRHGEHVTPTIRMRLKTAIDSKSGRSAEARLFSYSSLDRGQRFVFFIDADADANADADVDERLFQRLVRALPGEHRLGRSRSAEYGHARIEKISPPVSWSSRSRSDNRTTVWLLTDMAVENDWGGPAGIPNPEWLGLPPGKPIPEYCFTNYKQMSPFNAHYRANELERLLIERGSVLTYELEDRVADSDEPIRCAGIYRQCGSGWFWLDPPLLADDHPAFDEMNRPIPSVSTESLTLDCRNDQNLALWLQNKVEARISEEEVREKAEKWGAALEDLYRLARILEGVGPDVRLGPTPSQWNRIRELAREKALTSGAVDDDFLKIIFDLESSVCKQGDPDWSRRVIYEPLQKDGRDYPTFRDWLRYLLEQERTLGVRVLAYTARFAFDYARVGRAEEARDDA